MIRAVLAGAVPAAALAYAGPAVAAIGPVRRRLLRAIAGTGQPYHVALTFDDGPHPDATGEFLRVLDGAGVHATFFLIGEMVVRHPDVVRAIVDAGHEIGVHGYTHRLLVTRGITATRRDLTRAVAAITDVTGVTPRWWRPPYGVASTAAVVTARRLGLTPVLWTCWGRDWTGSATAASVERTVLRRLTGGGTVLLHDSDQFAAPRSWEATLGALPGILTACRARGWEVGPLRAHFAERRRFSTLSAEEA
jgi:peptidoglycan/xylan/chitin deacetylase (PgdA/CDA1 family)